MDDRQVFDYVEQVKQLKRDDRWGEAAELLERLVAATREQSARTGAVAAPWYWEQLAIVYRKQGRVADEVNLLQEYVDRNENPGSTGDALRARLPKAQALLSKRRTAS